MSLKRHEHVRPGSCAEATGRDPERTVQQRVFGTTGTGHGHNAGPRGARVGGLPEHTGVWPGAVRQCPAAARPGLRERCGELRGVPQRAQTGPT